MSETLQATDDVEASSPAEAEAGTEAEPQSQSKTEDLLVQEGDIAGDYLERLLDLLDYDGDIDLDVESGRAIVSIDGGEDLAKLVGPRGNVLESGESEPLAPMTPFERKVIHDAVAGVEGVRSESEGEEPQRRVVVLPD